MFSNQNYFPLVNSRYCYIRALLIMAGGGSGAMVSMDSSNKALAEGGWFNPLNPNSDKHLISPYSITG